MDAREPSSMGRVVIAATVVGLVVTLACLAWQSNHEHAQDQQALDFSYEEFDRQLNDMKLGPPYQYEPVEFDRAAPPLPARQPIITGIVVALLILAVGRVLVFMQRMEQTSRRT